MTRLLELATDRPLAKRHEMNKPPGRTAGFLLAGAGGCMWAKAWKERR